jgi:hypothetical protein
MVAKNVATLGSLLLLVAACDVRRATPDHEDMSDVSAEVTRHAEAVMRESLIEGSRALPPLVIPEAEDAEALASPELATPAAPHPVVEDEREPEKPGYVSPEAEHDRTKAKTAPRSAAEAAERNEPAPPPLSPTVPTEKR